MTIDKLRRLWYLSTVSTHSKESLMELHQLVREITAEQIGNCSRIPVCNLCVNHEKCMETLSLVRECAFFGTTFKNFELRMEDA
jgi:hypothetical protein